MEPYIRVKQLSSHQPQYKTDCMDGNPHPMDCEYFNYNLVDLGAMSYDKTESYGNTVGPFTPAELEIIKIFSEQPANEWGIANSFDGLYAHIVQDPSRFRTTIRFAVYMKEEHHIFWKLKFSGQ